MATNKQIEYAWENANTIKGKNQDSWRRDSEGNKIRKASYGTQGEYGWEVDHKNPKAKGGSENLRNIQALHWEENRKKSDNI
jgi:5-methylcytosine-specific restriction endonuclease McrA